MRTNRKNILRKLIITFISTIWLLQPITLIVQAEAELDKSIPQENILDEYIDEDTPLEEPIIDEIEATPDESKQVQTKEVEAVEVIDTDEVEDAEKSTEPPVSELKLEIDSVDDEVETINEMSITTYSDFFQQGDSSKVIRELKKSLLRLGYGDPNSIHWTNPDAFFGKGTETELKSFQNDYGLSVSGILDQMTSNKMDEIISNSYFMGQTHSVIRTLKTNLLTLGFGNPASIHWTNPDNYFGTGTVTELKTFQNEQGLRVSGILDPETALTIDALLSTGLAKGQSHEKIRKLKEDLLTLGFGDAKSIHWTNPDSFFGKGTEAELKSFQKQHDLPATGRLDSATEAKIVEVLQSNANKDDLLDANFSIGQSHDEIRTLKLNLLRLGYGNSNSIHWTNPDKYFGVGTKSELEAFQSQNNLPVNGILDAVTAQKIEELLAQSYTEGQSHREIRTLKQNLLVLGFGDPNSIHWTNPDSYFGAGTANALRDLQRSYGIRVSGVLDPITISTIETALQDTMRLGQISNEIRKLKSDLLLLGYGDPLSVHWLNPDSYFGPGLDGEIRKFQLNNNLPINGIVGVHTLAKIQEALANRKPVIYLDPGHGSSDRGAYYGGIAERDINLQVSNKVAVHLKNAGYNVIMSRDSKENSYSSNSRTDLFSRAEKANELGVDIFVSVHHNAMPWNSGVAGIETYYYGVEASYPPLPGNKDSHNDPARIASSRILANSIHKELINSTNAKDRGVRQGAYVVVRETKMPAVLLELGYMSNSNELKKLTSDSYQDTLANSIFKGINAYFGN